MFPFFPKIYIQINLDNMCFVNDITFSVIQYPESCAHFLSFSIKLYNVVKNYKKAPNYKMKFRTPR